MKHLLIAFQFLTRFPIRLMVHEDEIVKSVSFFPLVGIVLGLVLVFFYMILSPILATSLVSCTILLISLLMNGGLHIDGLSDTIDGLYGSSDRDTALDIMKDAHLGTMGAVAVVVVVLFKFSLYNQLTRSNFIPALIISNTVSKWVLVLSCTFFNSAKEEGLGALFIGKVRLPQLGMASFFLLLTLFLTKMYKSIVILVVVIIVAILLNLYFTRRIRGLTGDTLGAVNEFVEVISLFILISF